MWEIFSGARSPYPEIEKLVDVFQFVQTGGRMKAPPAIEKFPEIFSVMEKAWRQNPSDRPNFAELYTEISLIKKSFKHQKKNLQKISTEEKDLLGQENSYLHSPDKKHVNDQSYLKSPSASVEFPIYQISPRM
jgi:hypothetical protein